MLQIKWLKTDAGARVPEKANPQAGDAAFDLFAPTFFTLKGGSQVTLNLKLKSIIPEGWYCQILSKSGLASKYRISTRAGVIDAGYRDEWSVVLVNEGGAEHRFEKGQKVGQFIVLPVPEAECIEVNSIDFANASQVDRGGGFGSSGR